ncbi:MAG: hypothetical protein VX181_19295, partial [Pseudomonadota bacterium]|nr:hypothetical protein [Pseudomonadota bacterium]
MALVDALPHRLAGNAEAFSDLCVFQITLTVTEVVGVMALKCRKLLRGQILRLSFRLLLITGPLHDDVLQTLLSPPPAEALIFPKDAPRKLWIQEILIFMLSLVS